MERDLLTQATQKPRVFLLDALQWLAMFDIVAYHVDEDQARPVLGIGLPLFLITTILFSSRVKAGTGLVPLVKRRWSRLMVPWLIWCGVYALLQVGIALMAGEGPWAYFQPTMWLYGTKDHLWFLPFAFLAGLAVYGLAQWLRQHHAAWHDGAMIALLVPTVMLSMNWWEWSVVFPFTIWLIALPSVPLGMLIARWWQDDLIRKHQRLLIGLGAGMALLGVWGLLEAGPASYPTYARYAAASGLVLIAMAVGSRPVPGLWHHAHALLFSVYLVHPILIGVLKRMPTGSIGDLSLHMETTLVMLVSVVIGLLLTWIGQPSQWLKTLRRLLRQSGSAPKTASVSTTSSTE